MKFFQKILTLILICSTFIFANFAKAEDEEAVGAKVRAGTFLKVLNLSEISTLLHDIDDEVIFINSTDMFVYETLAIPENSKIYGFVEDVLEPVQGRDGAIKILIYKIITPDKKVYRTKGHIYSQNDNYIGGKQTESVYYQKMPYYMQGIKPLLKVTPLNIYDMGKHTVINPGSEFFVILEEDLILK